MKIFLGVIAVLLILMGLNAAPVATKDINPNAIVRLHDARDGKFFCSGVVISDKYILTAAHCVGTSFMGIKAGTQDLIELKNHNGDTVGEAVVHDFNLAADIAVLRGSFENLPKSEMVNDPVELANSLEHPILACGFPYGEELRCSKMASMSHFTFMLQAKGWLYPGMSGGPVIDMVTGKVIAVNSAVGGQISYLAPLIGIRALLQM